MERRPLGTYEAFRRWSGGPLSWGPSGSGWRMWFGGDVIHGICDVLDEHLAASRSLKAEAQPAAIGCVPWLTSDDVIDRLIRLGACCVVIDKGATPPGRLVDHGGPIPNVLPTLRETVPSADGAAPVVGPYSPMPEHDLGPIRVLGWSGTDTPKPLLHAKVLVLGELGYVTFSPDDAPEFQEFLFTPESVWWGSANWTKTAPAHLEAGSWSDDTELVQHATRFVEDLLLFSEPIESMRESPEPNLVHVEYDHEAMAEAAYEHWLAYLDHMAPEMSDLATF